ncbi:Retrotransposon gag protein [Corchorus olitorius]|uniref:Retrotransposon gag protein n=1 Tax=Corchorus olitorius TaxID=93759 RepID=A0A1R3KUZ7_9ROSI|nr:Retrotransposon gag protein [Corchorus olitorius]
MPPKPQTSSDEMLAQLTAAVASQIQDLQLNLESKYASLDARYTALTYALTEQHSSIHDLHAQISHLETQPPSSTSPSSSLLPSQNLNLQTPSITQFPKPPNNLHINSPKVNLSTFDGSNPLDWLFQVEQYFSFHAIEPHQRLPLVDFYMSGIALTRFKWLHRNNRLSDWDSFAQTLERRFGPSSYFNHEAALFKLKQTSTVADYKGEFEKLANKVDGLPASSLLNCFISGLLPQIQREMATLKPQTLAKAGDCASLIEEKLADATFPSTYPAIAPPRAPPTKPITEEEPSETKPSTVFSLASIPLPLPPPDIDEYDPSAFQVSLHALSGTSPFQTMKLAGSLKG